MWQEFNNSRGGELKKGFIPFPFYHSPVIKPVEQEEPFYVGQQLFCPYSANEAHRPMGIDAQYLQ